MALGVLVSVPLQFTHASAVGEFDRKASTLAAYTTENVSNEQLIRELSSRLMIAASGRDDRDRDRFKDDDFRFKRDRFRDDDFRKDRFDDDDFRFKRDRFRDDDFRNDRFKDDDFRFKRDRFDD